jgi:hypothetical protein
MFGSLSLYCLFDRRLPRGRRTRLPTGVRAHVERVEAGQAPGRLFHPTAEFGVVKPHVAARRYGPARPPSGSE